MPNQLFSRAGPLARALDQRSAMELERDCLAVSLALPINSDRLCQPPSRAACDAAEQSNASVFGFLLQEVDLQAISRPTDERLAAAVAPLRIKLDMLIDMTARLSYREVALPPVCEVESGRGASLELRAALGRQSGPEYRLIFTRPSVRRLCCSPK